MPIQILPPQLANQIAAGEVVERPASVVKELVENCLDAGASRVDIEVERGGSKAMVIRDNGLGIAEQELPLALSRHATSKVASLEDLESILSFGFRGEALASISSVSRLTLTSRTQEQEQGWQAYAEGREMAVKLQPAAHPVGTTVQVEDLFFNTPARRRFLRADKTEFNHIDEQLRRIALAKPTVHFTLSHNGKSVRQYRPARTERQHQQRLGAICGHRFADAALAIGAGNDQLQLHGHLAIGDGHQQFNEVQYFYVNGRVVRDRLVNHALRQALELHGQRLDAGYVLHLELPPQEVDVNVHPAKHEVRFHQARYVHDFILQGLSDAVAQLVRGAPGVGEEAGEYLISPAQSDSDAVRSPAADLGVQEQSSAPRTGYGSGFSGYGGAPGERGGERSTAGPAAATGYSPAPLQPAPSRDAVSNYGDLMRSERGAEPVVAGQKQESCWRWLTQLDDQCALFGRGDQLRLLPLKALADAVLRRELAERLPQGLVGQPLLLPVSVSRADAWDGVLESQLPLLKRLGLELAEQKQRLIIRKVPALLRQANLAQAVPELLQWLASFPAGEAPNNDALVAWLAEHSVQESTDAEALWHRWQQLPGADIETLLISRGRALPWRTQLES
ncbi:DNA mismatch repair endonuclease MutL [Ferrimonas sediminicola]|uniref:DNA mismatch repair protein MutL n=1 Tax=Ferrimonas sediminicola TaxID=2569538 RepID=A0A4U1BMM3_9GAMM|nr:DNA mismatch repair endonuclease MutL [Ferrimonas sediminicola]TKB51378.1 DNA mismatch repair endonuclease MutL [Ferrimonas sediminicola]